MLPVQRSVGLLRGGDLLPAAPLTGAPARSATGVALADATGRPGLEFKGHLDAVSSGASAAAPVLLTQGGPDRNQVAAVVQQAKQAGLYHQPLPNNQDGQNNAVPGLGGTYNEALKPYVFSPRRQTDQMVRQAFDLLPGELKANTAFVVAGRVAQDPEGALRYMQGHKDVVVVGSFKGINTGNGSGGEVAKVHGAELTQLDLSLKLARAAGLKVKDVVFAMGDSSPRPKASGGYEPNPAALPARDAMQARMNAVLNRNGVPGRALGWGADEQMMVAFARQLPARTVSLGFENPNARHFYDGGATTTDVAHAAAKEVGLQEAPMGKADIEARIFSLVPLADPKGAQTFPSGAGLAAQRATDERFAAGIAAKPADLPRTVIIDTRLNNGALDGASLPPATSVLGYSAWGTAANNVGQSLAMAKIVTDAQARAGASGKASIAASRQQLVVEAVAHDAFLVGYATGYKRPDNDLGRQVAAQGRVPAPGQVMDEQRLTSTLNAASTYATERLHQKYPGLKGDVTFAPQPFNRLFEAATMFSGGNLPQSGSLSTELLQKHPELRPDMHYKNYAPERPQTEAVAANGAFQKASWLEDVERYVPPPSEWLHL